MCGCIVVAARGRLLGSRDIAESNLKKRDGDIIKATKMRRIDTAHKKAKNPASKIGCTLAKRWKRSEAELRISDRYTQKAAAGICKPDYPGRLRALIEGFGIVLHQRQARKVLRTCSNMLSRQNAARDRQVCLIVL